MVYVTIEYIFSVQSKRPATPFRVGRAAQDASPGRIKDGLPVDAVAESVPSRVLSQRVDIPVQQEESLQVLLSGKAELLLSVAQHHRLVAVGEVGPEVPVPDSVSLRVGRRTYGDLKQQLPILEKEKIGPPQAVFPPVHRIPEMECRGINGRYVFRDIRLQGLFGLQSVFLSSALPGLPGKAVLLPHEAGVGVQERVPAGGGCQK